MIIWGIIVFAVVATALLLTFLVVLRKKDSVTPTKDLQPVTSTTEMDLPGEVKSLDQVSEAYQLKNYTEAIRLAKEHSSRSEFSSFSKLSALVICIDAASESNDVEAKNSCLDATMPLIDTLPETDRQGWTGQIEARKNGVIYTEGEDDITQ